MGKSVWGHRPRVNFILKKPGSGRRTFQVLRRVLKRGEKPKHETVANERLDAINASLLNELQDAQTCEIQVRELMADLQKIERQRLPTIVHNEENQRVLQQYWDKEYSDRGLTNPDAAYNRLVRAVSAVGSLSLFSASQSDLQKAVNKKYPDNRQRDVVAATNQLLKFIGRGIELKRRPEVVEDPHYLTTEELAAAQKHVEDPLDRLFQRVAFGTGLRAGEVFALTPESVMGAQFFTQHQIDRHLQRRHNKRKLSKRRAVYVLPGFEGDVREWVGIPLKTRLKMRNKRHAAILTAACVKAFPDLPEKHVVFHDLRHSYAIYLVSRGVSLSQVAQCLNNSVVVCERYYSGFVLKDETIESIKRIMEASAAL
jgi:integrase